MPIMITFRTGRVALIVVLAALMASCSREQQDWRSAEAADTSEAYGRFVEQHPDSELAARARERLAQLEEERDWADAGRVASVRSEEHTSELQSLRHLVCRLLLEKKKNR